MGTARYPSPTSYTLPPTPTDHPHLHPTPQFPHRSSPDQSNSWDRRGSRTLVVRSVGQNG